MPSIEVPGKAVGTAFWQKGPIAANVGVTGAVMVISIVATAPHCPAFGVNVYVVVPTVVVLIVAGAHVPVMPLFDTSGNAPATLF